MPFRELFLDCLLAFDEPIHGRVKLVLVRIGNAQIIGECRVGPGSRHAELAGLGRDDATGNHRDDEIALAR